MTSAEQSTHNINFGVNIATAAGKAGCALFKGRALKPYLNPNPRIGVMLRVGGASERLRCALNPRLGMFGLQKVAKLWPEERMLREVQGFDSDCAREWREFLAQRATKCAA